jgi:hypothetical protein
MKTRYRRLSKTNRIHFLKPYESFCKIDGADGYLDSDTSCKRYLYAGYRARRMKFIKMGKRYHPLFISLLRGWKRKNFTNKHYDDKMIYSNRKFWFYRTKQENLF